MCDNTLSTARHTLLEDQPGTPMRAPSCIAALFLSTVTDTSTRARGNISARLRLKHSLNFAFRSPRRDRGAGVDESMFHMSPNAGRRQIALRSTVRRMYSATRAYLVA